MEFGESRDTGSSTAVQGALARGLERAGHGDLGKLIESERKWRTQYAQLLLETQKRMLQSKQDCVAIAQACLEEFGKQMHWHGQALASVDAKPNTWTTTVLKGTGSKSKFTLPIPRESSARTATAANRSKEIVSLDDPKKIVEEVTSWVERGLCEPNVLDSIQSFLQKPFAQESDVFVCLGAGSEMGSTKTLLQLGATVVAIELPRKTKVWDDLIEFASKTPGTLVFPTNKDTGEKGADIIAQLPELMSWLVECFPERRMIIGSYLYLDGANFVKVAAAADHLSAHVQKVRPDTVLAYLCSPSEAFCVPHGASEIARRRWHEQSNLIDLAMRAIPTALEPNLPSKVGELLLQDCYTLEQGPNYAVAKLLQRFRSIVAGPSGSISNIAPASLTHSVMHMWVVKVGILGCERFGIVPFLPETSNAIMTALLLQDLRGLDNPDIQQAYDENPFLLWQHSAVHGGTWTCAFKTASTTKISVLAHFLNHLDSTPVKLAAALLAGTFVSSKL